LRSRRAGLKRMGLLALALVLALGALGVAHALWTDEVYLEGAVETGTLDINPISKSSMFVYKHPVTKDIIIDYPVSEANPPTGYDTIAGAEAMFWNTSGDLDQAQIDFWGLYPEQEFKADLGLIYCGTVPAKVSVATIDDPESQNPTDELLVELWDLWKYGDEDKNYDPHEYGIWIDGYHITTDSPPEETYYDSDDLLGVQLHLMERLDLTMHVLLPNDTDYKNKYNLGFSGIISVIQWNEEP
jgi:hypothetical protein